MTGFVQVAPDSTGKQLDNDVVLFPAGTTIINSDGTTSVLSAPAYYYRERIIIADPSDPAGLASVNGGIGPQRGEYGLVTHLPPGQADLQFIGTLLSDIRDGISTLAFGFPGAGAPSVVPEFALPVAGMPSGVLSPSVPRNLICDQFGRQVIVPHATREAMNATNVTITNNTANTLIAAGDTQTYNDIVGLVVANTSATAVRVDISDGTDTLPIYVPAGDTRGISLGGVIIPASKTGTAWTATVSSSVTDIRIWVLYVSNKAR